MNITNVIDFFCSLFALCITCAFPWHPSPKKVRERIRAKEQASQDDEEHKAQELREDYKDVKKKYDDPPTETDYNIELLRRDVKTEVEAEA